MRFLDSRVPLHALLFTSLMTLTGCLVQSLPSQVPLTCEGTRCSLAECAESPNCESAQGPELPPPEDVCTPEPAGCPEGYSKGECEVQGFDCVVQTNSCDEEYRCKRDVVLCDALECPDDFVAVDVCDGEDCKVVTSLCGDKLLCAPEPPLCVQEPRCPEGSQEVSACIVGARGACTEVTVCGKTLFCVEPEPPRDCGVKQQCPPGYDVALSCPYINSDECLRVPDACSDVPEDTVLCIRKQECKYEEVCEVPGPGCTDTGIFCYGSIKGDVPATRECPAGEECESVKTACDGEVFCPPTASDHACFRPCLAPLDECPLGEHCVYNLCGGQDICAIDISL